MRALLAIIAIAGAIRLASALSPVSTGVVVAALAIAAAGYGLVHHARSQWRWWAVSWGLVGLGLLGNLASLLAEDLHPGTLGAPAALALALALAGDAAAAAGMLLLIHERAGGEALESLAWSTVATAALAFPLLVLVWVPALGWHPARDVTVGAPALGALVVVLLSASVLSIGGRRPSANGYLFAGAALIFAARAASAALALDGRLSSPVPLDAVLLWGACLWACAMLHPSHRHALDPGAPRSSRPGWVLVGLMVIGALTGPGVVVAASVLHARTDAALLDAGAVLLPVLVTVSLLHQVFQRSAAEHRAQHDPLTGVCNQTLFNDKLEAALVDARRSRSGLVVMFLDLDRFKGINDSLGHAVGNQLLQAVVQRLQSRLRPRDTLARMGGDEFTILFPEVQSPDEPHALAERVLGAFSEPFHVGGKLLALQTSIGIALHPADGDDGETLFKNADIAMYQAKAAGRNTYCVFDPAMSSRAELHFALETSLRQALDRGRLAVHYQPKISTLTGQVLGVEALARWEHPRLGFIPPSTFVPIAEETNLIGTLGEWVLEAACAQARRWQDGGLPHLTVSVNLSPRQFVSNSVAQLVGDVLHRTGLDPSALELEVTESVLVEHMEATAASLAELRAMGVRCSIDDFGTGYSALTYLAEMPVDAIKIDPTFVRRIDDEDRTAPIVGAVIALAHSLGLEVVAEGVETLAQLRFLQDEGCDQVQGYLFSPPVPPEEIVALVSGPGPLGACSELLRPRVSAGSLVLPSDRIARVLASLSHAGAVAKLSSRDDLLSVLGALQADQALSAPAGSTHTLAARVALGSLIGLVSLTGGLGAAGALPPAAQQLTGEILHQTLGVTLPSLPRGISEAAPAASAAPPSEAAPGPLSGSPASGGASASGSPTSGGASSLQGAGAGAGAGAALRGAGTLGGGGAPGQSGATPGQSSGQSSGSTAGQSSGRSSGGSPVGRASGGSPAGSAAGGSPAGSAPGTPAPAGGGNGKGAGKGKGKGKGNGQGNGGTGGGSGAQGGSGRGKPGRTSGSASGGSSGSAPGSASGGSSGSSGTTPGSAAGGSSGSAPGTPAPAGGGNGQGQRSS